MARYVCTRECMGGIGSSVGFSSTGEGRACCSGGCITLSARSRHDLGTISAGALIIMLLGILLKWVGDLGAISATYLGDSSRQAL